MRAPETFTRWACIRQTENNFYLAIKENESALLLTAAKDAEKFEVLAVDAGDAYKQLDDRAISSIGMSEGSNLYVFDRKDFGYGIAGAEVDSLSDFTEVIRGVTKGLGGMAIDPLVTEVSSRARPEPTVPVELW